MCFLFLHFFSFPSSAFYMESARDHVFASLQDLVVYYLQQRGEVLGPLRLPDHWASSSAAAASATTAAGAAPRQVLPVARQLEPEFPSPPRRESAVPAQFTPPPRPQPQPLRQPQHLTPSPPVQQQHRQQQQQHRQQQQQHQEENTPRAPPLPPRSSPSSAPASWDLRALSTSEARLVLAQQAVGTFAVRYSPTFFATLSIVLPTKLYNAHIEETADGFHLKKSDIYHESLASLVQYYNTPHPELPFPLNQPPHMRG